MFQMTYQLSKNVVVYLMIFQIKAREDGDCLPACGTEFVYGKDKCPKEIRICIIYELATHSELYFSDAYLSQGLYNQYLTAANRCLPLIVIFMSWESTI